MIRSALKAGIKKVLGMAPARAAAPPPPPPAWKAESTPSKPTVVAAPVTPAAPPSVETPAVVVPPVAAAPVEAAAPAVEVAPVAEVAPAVEVAPGADAAPAVEAAPADTAQKKTSKKKAAAKVAAALEEAVPSEPVVAAPVADVAATEPATDVVGNAAFSWAQVQELMDEMVRPALQGDGGDITLIKIENNDVYVKLVGSCSTCPSSIMTMKMGVEALLKEELPGFGNLIQVD